jgi:GH15 family glucan-1,4-alpha-glucosidase
MPLAIEDYALIGDTHTAALVGRDGSIDWLCLPRFDSDACFAALLGGPDNGNWRISPVGAGPATRRRYRGDTLVLETEWDTEDGTVRVIDFMPHRHDAPDVVRIVEGVSGTVRVDVSLRLRFGYGREVPWVRRSHGQIAAVAGPDSVWISTPVHLSGQDYSHAATFAVSAGDRVPFVLTWHPSHEPAPDPVDAESSLAETVRLWEQWARGCTFEGEYREAVMRSMITLKALTYAPTGGIVAAPTTSLPETLGGGRNWDYRYCWLRDATITLEALLRGGFAEEARAWRRWLVRAVAGSPENLQIMYGVAGERRLAEWEVPWLPGYEGSAPVRVGNAAVGQVQLDVYGEVLDSLHLALEAGAEPEAHVWDLVRSMLSHLADQWHEPDEGLWEMRGPRRHFVHSKVMAWTAFDRAVLIADKYGFDGDLDDWRRNRDAIKAEVFEKGYDAERNTFTQYYGASEVDAALLQLLEVGFVAPDDPRAAGTVDAVAEDLMVDGFVVRYRTGQGQDQVDGLTGEGTEGAFLACSFWMAEALRKIGREKDARDLFERLLALRNDVGLLAEEYDPRARRLVGNFPQAFSHVPLVKVAFELADHDGVRHYPRDA